MILASTKINTSYSSYLFSTRLKQTRIGASLNFSFKLSNTIITLSIYLNYYFPLSNTIIFNTTKLYQQIKRLQKLQNPRNTSISLAIPGTSQYQIIVTYVLSIFIPLYEIIYPRNSTSFTLNLYFSSLQNRLYLSSYSRTLYIYSIYRYSSLKKIRISSRYIIIKILINSLRY